MELIAMLVALAMSFGAGYEAGQDPGCDTLFREVTEGYADDGLQLLQGGQFPNGFVVVYGNVETMQLEQNVFSSEPPPPEEAELYVDQDQECTTAQGNVLRRYVFSESKD